MHKISLSDKLPVNLGMVYENVVAQELTAHGRRLFYHTWPKPGTTRNYEIDFIVPDGKKVSPVEVKSSNYRTRASLDAFCGKYSSRVGRQGRRRRLHSDLHVRVPIGRGMVTVDQIAAMTHVGRSTIYRCLNADSMKMD